MFDLIVWDSPLALVAEIALSVAFIAGTLFVARVVNARSGPSADGGRDAGNAPLERDE